MCKKDFSVSVSTTVCVEHRSLNFNVNSGGSPQLAAFAHVNLLHFNRGGGFANAQRSSKYTAFTPYGTSTPFSVVVEIK